MMYRKLYIADARPRKNALANGAMGGGSESSANYLQCEVVFLGIDNIHAMRDSLARLRDFLDIHGAASSDGSSSLLVCV
jgi:myotubularin-related protein 1/2